jgi:hypothetical protein
MTLPRLLKTMLPRLYELRSLLRTAFTSMGTTLEAKMSVETVPASIGRPMSMAASFVVGLDSLTTLGAGPGPEHRDRCPFPVLEAMGKSA